MNHDELHDQDAAYVLGALSPSERRAFEAHLTACRECARSVHESAGMPGLLASVPRELAEAELVEPPPVPDTLLPRLVREVRHRRARRSWTIGAAAAVAAGAVTLGGVGLAGALGGGGGPAGTVQASSAPTPRSSVSGGVPGAAGAPVAMQRLGQGRLRATVAFTPRAWGTRVDLTCDYGSGHDYGAGAPPSYQLVVGRADGTTQQVASWRAVAGRELTLHGATSWRRADIAIVEVRTEAGRPVLRLDR